MTLIEQFGDQIINEAAEKARNQLRPDYAQDSYERYYMDLQDILQKQEQKQGLLNSDPKATDIRNKTLAVVFEMSVLNSLVAADAIKGNIDSYFDNPENAHFFQDVSKEQVDEFRQRLKDTVTEKLAVQAKTERGREFVNQLTEKFNNEVKNSDPVKRNSFERGAFFPIVATLQALSHDNVPNLTLVEGEENTAARLMATGIAKHSNELAGERDTLERYIDYVVIPYKGKDSLKETEFITHFQENNLTAADKAWAEYFFDNAVICNDHDNLDFNSFMLNGEPMFSKQQINEADPQELKTQVIGKALLGEEVTHKDGDSLKLVSPSVDKENYSIWDRIIDFFRNLLGIHSMENTINDREADNMMTFHNHMNAPLREKVTMDELSGKTVVDKIIKAEKQSPVKEKALDKSAPTF